jgi:hypothetical protein
MAAAIRTIQREDSMREKEIVSQNDVMVAALTKLQTEHSLDYGSFLPMTLLKELAKPYDAEKQFPFFMMALTERCRELGFVLSSAELAGTGYRVLQQVEHYHVGEHWHNEAYRAYDKIIILMSSMKRDKLTDAEKLRDDNFLRQMRYERQMLIRADDAIKSLKKHAPSILKPDVEV